MPLSCDYTRCMGVSPDCPQRDNCARHRCIPDNAALSWSRNLNADAAVSCPHFIPYQAANLASLNLPTLTHNALRRAGYRTTAEVAALSDEQLKAVRNIGTQGLQLIRQALGHWQANTPTAR